MCFIYTTYVLWLLTLPKFLLVWKALIAYDEKYQIATIRKTKYDILYILVQCSVICSETLANAVANKANMDLIVSRSSIEKLEEESWLIKIFGSGSAGWSVGAHMCIIQFAVGLALQFILEFSIAIRRRIALIQLMLRTFQTLSCQEIDICYTQIIDLITIFDKLRRAANLIVVTFLTSTSVLIIIYMFLLVVNLDMFKVSSVEILQFAFYFI